MKYLNNFIKYTKKKNIFKIKKKYSEKILKAQNEF